MPDRSEPNFYQLMLGLPAEVTQPDHYQLLGLERFAEGDEAIRAAAADQNGKLLSWQNSKYYKDAGRLMLELAKARGVLLDPEQKLGYDEQLGRDFGDEEPVILLQAAAEEEPIVLEAAPKEPPPQTRRPQRTRRTSALREKPRSSKRASKPKLPARFSVFVGCALSLTGLGALAWSAWNGSEPASEANLQTASGEETEPSSVLDTPAVTSTTDALRTQVPMDANPPPLAVVPFDERAAALHQAAWAKHENVPVEVTNSIGMKLRLIPAGEFLMGIPFGEPESRRGEQPHRVRITKPYYLSRYEVSTDQYVQAMGTSAPLSRGDQAQFNFYRDGPMLKITFYDALAFCNRLSQKEGLPPFYALEITSESPVKNIGTPTIRDARFKINGGPGYRLPTEAEWEFACRAGTTTATHYGNALAADQANFRGSAPYNGGAPGPDLNRPQAVGSYRANAFGLYDMHGNAAEWCIDALSQNIENRPLVEDPITEPSGRFQNQQCIRGGSFIDAGELCRSGFRRGLPPAAVGVVGIRVARAVSGPVPKAPKVAGSSPKIETPNVKTPRVADSSNAPPFAKSPFNKDQAAEHQAAWAKHLNVPVEVTNKAGMKLRLIPPGEFLMGSPPEEEYRNRNETQQLVRLTKPFYFCMKEVTDEEYIAVFGTKHPYADYFSEPEKDPNLPMFVSWYDCIMYCNKLSEKEDLPPYYTVANVVFFGGRIKSLNASVNGGTGYRLPTEAEWEYACRAGTITAYNVGDSLSAADAIFRNNAPPRPKLQLGGSSPPNGFGLFDMHGNVAEWCFDYVGSNQTSSAPLIDPVRNVRGDLVREWRVYRGGRFNSQASQCRSAYQSKSDAFQAGVAGFRVARTVGSSGTRRP